MLGNSCRKLKWCYWVRYLATSQHRVSTVKLGWWNRVPSPKQSLGDEKGGQLKPKEGVELKVADVCYLAKNIDGVWFFLKKLQDSNERILGFWKSKMNALKGRVEDSPEDEQGGWSPNNQINRCWVSQKLRKDSQVHKLT